jgi:two-component sensor histidine kinase
MKTSLFACIFLFFSVFGAYGQTSSLDSVYNLAVEKLRASDITGATALLLTAQKIAEKDNNLKFLCIIQVSLGKIGIVSENNQSAAEANIKGLNYCSACKDTISLGKLSMQKGVLKAKQQQNDSALVYFKQGAEYFLLKKDSLAAASAFAKVGNILELEGQYKSAQPYYQDYYKIAQKDPESFNFLTANIFLTGNYTYSKQTDKALFHNNLVLKISQKLHSNYEYSEGLRYDAIIHSQMGEYKLAYEKMMHFAQYYQDTLMGKLQLDKAAEMRAMYDAEKKEAQIALQEAQLGRERWRFWVVIGGLITALIVGALLFRITRQLRKRNEEKEFLIKEIHHRVKNNLQILSSLLHLQSRQITDDTALSAVREGQNRVDAMGLIHQKLYMGYNVAKVEMKDYLEQFGQNMLDSFGIEDDRVQIEYALDQLYLDVDTAIPLGLIINELVTNALKYAFPNGRSGAIRIALSKNEQNHLCLIISDNGVGQANTNKDVKSTAFGTKLIQMLSKKLKGTPEILPQEIGYATRIVFEQYA